jgi:hypothetical protein
VKERSVSHGWLRFCHFEALVRAIFDVLQGGIAFSADIELVLVALRQGILGENRSVAEDATRRTRSRAQPKARQDD